MLLRRVPRPPTLTYVLLTYVLAMPESELHAQYDWTTGVPDNGNEWRKFRGVPRQYPLRSLVCILFKKGGSIGAFRLPEGRAGIISIVRWNLRLVIFGVEERVLLWGRVTPFLDHFSKHLSSVLGRTELCHEVRNPRPQKPEIILQREPPFSESSKPVHIRTCPRETPRKTKTNMSKFRAPTPSSVSSEQEQTYITSHPLVEDIPAEDLPAAGGGNSGRFAAR